MLPAVAPTAPDQEVRVEGEELHATRSAPGDWSQRRFQQRTGNRWQQNFGAIAEALTKLVGQVQPRLVAISGDVRAVQFLRLMQAVRSAAGCCSTAAHRYRHAQR
jgi:hypothetical protein